MIDYTSPTLIVTVGLPRSGKSTWARDQQFPVVCPDAIRLAMHGEVFIPLAEPFVWAIAGVMVRALFLAGHKLVIVDGCHVKRKHRQHWVRMGIDPCAHWRTIFKVVETPELTCIERAQSEKDEDIIPVIQKMGTEWEPLGADEERVPFWWPGVKLLGEGT